ncbi:MAG TPA: hypothetical protein VEL07_10930 [Planctomycetota bacterium]|nr:hypothetical protein [Planctomycetota bacterium]
MATSPFDGITRIETVPTECECCGELRVGTFRLLHMEVPGFGLDRMPMQLVCERCYELVHGGGWEWE